MDRGAKLINFMYECRQRNRVKFAKCIYVFICNILYFNATLIYSINWNGIPLDIYRKVFRVSEMY